MKATKIVSRFVDMANGWPTKRPGDIFITAHHAGSVAIFAISSQFTRITQSYCTEDLQAIEDQHGLHEFMRDLVDDCITALANAANTLENYKPQP